MCHVCVYIYTFITSFSHIDFLRNNCDNNLFFKKIYDHLKIFKYIYAWLPLMGVINRR